MDDIEQKLISYIREANSAKSILSQLKSVELDSLDIQHALCEKLGIEDFNAFKLLDENLSSDKIIEILKDYMFSKPETLDEIVLDESILPVGTPKLLTEQTVKMKGEIWVIHKNDADPFPSNPHAHNYASGISLHLGTGEFFRKRDSQGSIPCKTLKELRAKIKGHELPELDSRCN